MSDSISKGRPPKNLAEIGYSGLKHTSGYVREEFLKDLQGDKGVKMYRQMRDNDPVIAATLFVIERIILQCGWQVVMGGSDEKDKKAAEHVKSCLSDMSHSFEDFISEVLTMLHFGWAYFNIVYKQRRGRNAEDPRFRSKYDDGLVGWRKFSIRAQESLDKWDFDETGGIRGLWQRADTSFGTSANTQVFVPIDRSILFRTKINKNNPEGYSLLRPIYRPYAIKKIIEELEAIGIERDLVGFPVLTPPEEFDLNDIDNTDVKTWAQDLVTHIKRDEQEGVLLPPGWKLELVGSPGSRQFNISEVIERWDKRITMSLLTQFLMLGMERTGSYALSQNQSDIFMISLVGWVESIGETFNRFAIQPMIDMNASLSNGNYPVIKPLRPVPPDLDSLSNYLFKLSRGGLLVGDPELEDFLRKLAFLTESPAAKEMKVVDPVQAEKDRMKARADMQEALAQAQLKNQEAKIKPKAGGTK